MFSFSCNLIFQMPFKKTKKMKLEHERGSFRTQFRLSVHLFIVLVIEKKGLKNLTPSPSSAVMKLIQTFRPGCTLGLINFI